MAKQICFVMLPWSGQLNIIIFVHFLLLGVISPVKLSKDNNPKSKLSVGISQILRHLYVYGNSLIKGRDKPADN